MAHPYHHSLSSVKKWGGTVEDYVRIHSWFDESKQIIADFRHRALRHHAEDMGFIPSFADWVKAVRPEPWMGRAQKPDDLKGAEAHRREWSHS